MWLYVGKSVKRKQKCNGILPFFAFSLEKGKGIVYNEYNTGCVLHIERDSGKIPKAISDHGIRRCPARDDCRTIAGRKKTYKKIKITEKGTFDYV